MKRPVVPGPEEEGPGLPWPRSWRGVYVFVAIVFVVWVALLWLLPRIFG
ncbi:MAG TPA: hypothetical protein VG838_04950 [Opitutaceae bacterium]|nr:hypothetical protein [Opitutaceae bacterium]